MKVSLDLMRVVLFLGSILLIAGALPFTSAIVGILLLLTLAQLVITFRI